MADRFDKFTERARRVLTLAQEEAQRFNHNYIGTEHLLLGLVRQGDGVAATALTNLGVELNRVRSAVEFLIGRGDRAVLGEIGLTPRSKKVIEYAVDEARKMNHNYIGTEHLLLGLVREGEGIAAGVLESLGVSLDSAREEVLRILPNTERSGAQTPPLLGRWWYSAPNEGIVQGFALAMALTQEAHRAFIVALEREAFRAHGLLQPEALLTALLQPGGTVDQILKGVGASADAVQAAIDTAGEAMASRQRQLADLLQQREAAVAGGDEDLAAEALGHARALQAELASIATVDERPPAGTMVVLGVPVSQRCWRVLGMAWEGARAAGRAHHVGAVDLLHAMLDDSSAMSWLWHQAGIDVDVLRAAIAGGSDSEEG